MDDKYDLVGFFLSKDGLLRSGIIGLLEGTPLEESAGSLSFATALRSIQRMANWEKNSIRNTTLTTAKVAMANERIPALSSSGVPTKRPMMP